jgi:AmmeMemoRadiSam system protein B
MPVDEGLAAAIAADGPVVHERPAAHAREHSLEMQLPFLARQLPGVPIVPIVMGDQGRDTSEALGRAIASGVTRWSAGSDDRPSGSRPREALLVASSDLSHFENATDAAALDAVVLTQVDACNPRGLMDALEREPRHACGGGAMVAVLHAARLLGATTARVLRYGDSGDVSGDKSSVVGYMAAAIW